MKKYIFFIIVIAMIKHGNLSSQVAIKADGSPPDASAILDVQDSTRGVLFPRMTEVQRDNISSPDTSLIIYNTDKQAIQFYDGLLWRTLYMGDCTPEQPGSISGNMYPCYNQSGLTYSIVSVEGATSYHWTAPPGATITAGQGDANITVTMGTQNGNVSVRAQSGCGNSTYRDLPVSDGRPESPGSISGNPIVGDNDSGELYFLPAVARATSYVWDVPSDASIVSGQGTDSIYVDFGTTSDTISVYATNSCGNSDTVVLFVQVFGCGEPYTDLRDNHTYNTVSIGSQCWMKENLVATQYNDGTPIPLVTDGTAWAALSTPGYCWYANDSAAYASSYGALYNWYTVSNDNPCPPGWYVPGDTIWKALEMALGMTLEQANGTGFRGTDEGGKMKETGTSHWHSPNTGATDSSGFTARGGGYRHQSSSVFYERKNRGYFWSSTAEGSDAWQRGLWYNSEQVNRATFNKKYGMSIRCFKGPDLDSGEVYSAATDRIWMDRNLGADRVAQSSGDTLAYGDLYQWGRLTDGHEDRYSGTTTTLSQTDVPGHDDMIITPSGQNDNDWRNGHNDNLWQGEGGINNPCPAGFRIPTVDEWQAEMQSWSSNDDAGAINSPLRLPKAGRRQHTDGSLIYVGVYGYCWSSTVDGIQAIRMHFGPGIGGYDGSHRAIPYSVRCIKD